ncbi:hypothetical protein M3Y96_01207600 [Aphelenchoides besseyi]|nr:hypothetical protein M3Y96_01207600 [Aphelenchoides besseyi]
MEHKTNDEAYYTCFCGLHVHKGTLLIAVITVIQAFFYAPVGYFLSFGYLMYVTATCSILSIFANVVLIIGNRKHRPKLYIPVLIINPLIILVFILFDLAAFVYGILSIFKIMQLQNMDSDLAGLVNLIFSVLYTIVVVLDVYFSTVIYRSYVWLKEVQNQSNRIET